MREILFRGKTFAGKWIEGFLFQANGDCIVNWCISRTPLDANDYSEILGDWAEVHPETVGQYTGLHDKNGKKIFEGDIVDYKEEYGCIEYHDCEAMFVVSSDTWLTDFDHMYGKEVEVIGNIHDNPELLKGGADNAD